jgi:hypothetical protein
MHVLSLIVFFRKNKNFLKIHDSKILITCSTLRKKIHYFVIFYYFCNKNKTPKLLVLTNIILNNDIDFVKKLNELEEQLISPCLSFAQIWRLQGYGQYNIKGSIINVPSNINFTQSILFCLPHDETTISLSLKRQMEYKSPYLTTNIGPNLIMLALHDFFNAPSYENSRITIHPCWLDMFTLSMQTNINIFYDVDDDESCDHNNEDRFEEEQEDILIDTMVQNILSSKQIYNYFENAITMALGQDFKPLGLFQDLHCEELNSPTLFFGQPHSNQGIKMSYQMIVQWEFLHKNHNFATHVPIYFLKLLKY